MDTESLEEIKDELISDILDKEDAYKERYNFYNSILDSIDKLKNDVNERVNGELGELLDEIHSMSIALKSIRIELKERGEEI